MTDEQLVWLERHALKLQVAAEYAREKAQNPDAIGVLMGKAGTARFIYEKLRDWPENDRAPH